MIPRNGPNRGGAKANLLVPSTTVGDWADPNSVLKSVAISGRRVSLTLQNPAASRDLPSTGASIAFPLVNLVGQSVASLDNAALRQLMLRFQASADVPADCWVGLTLINASTVAAATLGVGITVQGNGTGLRASRNHYNAGWVVAGAATYTTGLRYAVWYGAPLSTNATQTRGITAAMYDSTGAYVSAASGGDGTTNYTSAPSTYVALSTGWIAGTGAADSVVSFEPYQILSKPSNFPV